MIFNRKVEVIFSIKDMKILDGQSKICNWLYNKLLEISIKDYNENNNEKNLLNGRNLRDLVPVLKRECNFLNTVHSSPLKNTALRLKDSYIRFFDRGKGFPHFKAWKDNWFSLFYDEPNKGFSLLDGNTLQISLGVDELKNRLKVTGKLKENLSIRKEDKIKNFRLCKQYGERYYAVFCIERKDIKLKDVNRWLSIDPNHKNLFVAVDNNGVSYEFCKLYQLKYWDEVVDSIKSKRDICVKKSKTNAAENGTEYFIPSKRWSRLNKALDRAYNSRREQIKSACYSIANWTAKNYDYVAFGDYTPTVDTAVENNMHRSMLNQEVIGTLRNIMKWVMRKSGKTFSLVDEKDTTSTCSVCGYREKKDPSIREFTCPKCNHIFNRDINSGINIAKKDKILSGSDYVGWDLSKPTYTAKWNFTDGKVLFAGCITK